MNIDMAGIALTAMNLNSFCQIHFQILYKRNWWVILLNEWNVILRFVNTRVNLIFIYKIACHFVV